MKKKFKRVIAMKNAAIFLCICLMTLVSCNQELIPNNEESNSSSGVVFNISAIYPDAVSTKAVKTGWENGDVIFVFFSRQSAPAYLEMSWNGSTWENTPKQSLSLSDSETGTMTAVYLPFGSDASVMSEGNSYKFSDTYFSYYLTDQKSYTVSNGEVTATFKMKIPEGYIQFFLDDASADESNSIELREPKLTPQGITSIAEDGTIVHSTIACGAPLPGYVYDKENKLNGENKGWLFSGILDVNARNVEKDYHFTLVEGGWNGNYYGKAYAAKTFYRGIAEGRALKLPALSGWTVINDYKPIDLGCDKTIDGVSRRIYWSSRNVGATTDFPSSSSYSDIAASFGGYYAWGEIETKSGEYYWNTYKFMKPSYADWKYINKYTCADGQTAASWYEGGEFIGDNKTILDIEDDAANAVLGGIWRMPTEDEWFLLSNSDNFTFEPWMISGSFKGSKVFSNIAGFDDGRYIFIPANGYRGTGTQLYSTTTGYYYTPALYEGNSSWSRGVTVNKNSGLGTTWGTRSKGFAIRPVTE